MADSSADRDPLDRLAEEFVARFRAGERPSLTEYAARLPDRADEVRELFPALVELEQLKPNTADRTGDYTPAVEPSDPTRVGEFRILRRVGVGGMGAVYEAVQESLGRHVALKLLPLDAVADPKRLERFRREAKAAAKLHHSNIVPVYGTGEADGRHYYAMQFIAGHPLDAVIDEVRRLKDESAARSPRAVSELAAALATGAFPPPVDADATVIGSPSATGPQVGSSPSSPSPSLSDGGRAYWATVARLGAQAADALAYAHGQGVLHRDIKPANLLLDLRGTVWVADFGLAKSTDADDLTLTGDVIGTLRYMAPERFEGQGDQRADIYALGLTLYELLALQPAFQATSRAKLVELAIAANPPKPRAINPAIPRDLETIVLKAIARDPAMRYQTAGELADDLRRYLEDRSILARRATPVEQAWRWCRRNPAVAGLAAAVLCVLSAGVMVSSLLALGQRSARLAEGMERQKATDAQLAAEAEGAKTKTALADSYAATGLAASDPAEAMVWFAHAAEVAGAGTERERLNRERLVRWDADTPKPVRVLDHKDDTMIQRMEFHPAGRHLMTKNTRSTDWKGRWRLWDLDRGAEAAWPGGHTNVSAAAFDPTGRHVAFGTEQGEFVLATFPAGEVVFSAKREVPILSVTFDASGDRLAFARGIHIEYVDVPTRTLRPQKSCRSTAGLTMTPERERRMDQTLNNMEIGFAPTGDWLYATVGPELWIYSWDDPTATQLQLTRTYEPSAPNDVYNRPPTSPQFADDGHALFLGFISGDGTVSDPKGTYRVSGYDPLRKRVTAELQPDGGWKGRLLNYALSPDRRHAFVVTNNTQYIMDLRTGRPVRDRIDWSGGDKGTALSQAFSPDGLTLYTAWTDGQVRQHAVATGLVSGPPLRFSQRVNTLAVSPDGSHLATAEPGGLVRLWRLKAQGGGFDLPLVGRYSLARFSSDGKYVFPTGSTQRESSTSSVRVYDVRTREPIGPPLTIQLVACADATADAALVAVGGLSDELKQNLDGTTTLGEYEIANLNPGSLFNSFRSKVWLWDPRTGRQACPPISLRHPIRSLKLHPDGTAVAVLTADGSVAVYEVPSGKPLRSWKAHEPFFQGNHFVNNGELKFDPTGKYLATYGPNDCTANVWDPATGKLVVALKHPKKSDYLKLHDVTFSPDGKRAFTTCWTDNAVRSWDLPSGEPAGPPLVHADWPFMVDLHPDGTTLVSACRDEAAHVWNWTTGKELLAGLRHDGEVAGVAYTPDGATIVTAGHDERVRLWDAATGRAVAPPVRTDGRALVPVVSKDGRFVAVGGQMPRPPVIDLRPEVAPTTTAEVELRAGSRFDAAGLTRIPTAEWLARWDADPTQRADPVPSAAESAADWHRLSLAECRGDWKAVAAVAERLMTRQPDNWSLIARRFRALGELGDYAAANDLLKNVPWFLYTREKENIPLDQFLLLRARAVLNLQRGPFMPRDLNVSTLLTNFGDLREPKLFSQIPWTWALQDPYSSERFAPIGVRSKEELALIDLTKKARGSDVGERRYYRISALMNYRVAPGASSLESSRGSLRAGLDRIADIEVQTNATLQEVDHVILALIQHALGQTAEAKASLELAECMWAAAVHDNPTARTYDWLERLERELLLEEARRTLKNPPRFAERTAPPRRPRTP